MKNNKIKLTKEDLKKSVKSIKKILKELENELNKLQSNDDKVYEIGGELYNEASVFASFSKQEYKIILCKK